MVIVSLAILTVVRNADYSLTRQLDWLEKSSTKHLGQMTDLALEALETVQELNKKVTKGGKF